MMGRWLSSRACHVPAGRDEPADDAARGPDDRQPPLRLLPGLRPQTGASELPRAQTIRLRCPPCGDQLSAPVQQTSVYACDSSNRTLRRLIVLSRFGPVGPNGSPDDDPPSGPACGQRIREHEQWHHGIVPRRQAA